MTEETRQSLEDEYLFTRDYPAIHAALNQRRTLVACIERQPKLPQVCMVAVNPDGLIAFTNGYLKLSFAANTLEDFTTACRAMNVAFFIPYEEALQDFVQRAGAEIHNRFATFCMWLGAITLALALAALFIATLAAFQADLPLFR